MTTRTIEQLERLAGQANGGPDAARTRLLYSLITDLSKLKTTVFELKRAVKALEKRK